MKRNNDMRRGNDLLYKIRGEADEFEAYRGPMGGDMKQSILGPQPDNLDNPGGDGPVQVVVVKGRGKGRG